jgi:hypothetical protein
MHVGYMHSTDQKTRPLFNLHSPLVNSQQSLSATVVIFLSTKATFGHRVHMRLVEACFVRSPAVFGFFFSDDTLFTFAISVMVAGKFAEE